MPPSPTHGGPALSRIGRRHLPLALLIVAATAYLTFRHTIGFDFVNWDDTTYIAQNPAFRALSWGSIGWVFAHFYYFAYIPVTLSSYAVDMVLLGRGAGGHHLTNVLLHTLNAAGLLVAGVTTWTWVRAGWTRAGEARTGRTRARAVRSVGRTEAPPSVVWGMAAAAALWALHPLRAESVAWISDRKDLLCVFFLIPALITYERGTSRETGSVPWLTASFLLFALALLSKSAAVFFPLALVALDWLRGRRGWAVLQEKIPFLLLAGAVAALSLWMTPHTRPDPTYALLAPSKRLFFPFYAVAFPLFKTVAPSRLSPLYPRAEWDGILAGVALVATVTVAAVLLARRGRRGPLVAWLVTLTALAPNVAGLGSGLQPVADRYAYLATIPLFLLAGAGLGSLLERAGPARRLGMGATLLALGLALAALAASQAELWASSRTLWESVIRRAPDSPDVVSAYLNLGAVYDQEGKRAESRALLERAARLDPGNAKVRYNLGIVCWFLGDRAKALASLREATTLDSTDAMAFYNRALMADQSGYDQEGISSMVRAARLGLRDAQEALRDRGIAW